MYARFVPGAAGAGANKAAGTLATDKPTTATATMTAPTSYGRYIPGAGIVVPTVQHIVNEPEESRPAKKVRLSPHPDNESTKQKKKRKSKIRTAAVETSSASDTSTDDEANVAPLKTVEAIAAEDTSSDEEVAEAPSPAEHSPEPEKVVKKPKREKKKKSIAADETEGEDGVQKRHKAVFERKRKSMQAPATAEDGEMDTIDGEDAEMVDAPLQEDTHGLEPLPQPAPVEIGNTKPTFETLPPWLAEPLRVSPQATANFADLSPFPELGISAEVSQKLAASGYKNAFAIQTAVIPLLLPHHCKSRQGDVLVSAATGSGKTLAYALPMIRDLSYGNRRLTRLRSLVVLPTRELVKQAQQVCEEIAGAFASDGVKRRVRVGVSMGSQNFEKEQATFIDREEQYDPVAFAAREKRAKDPNSELDDDFDETDDEEKAEVSKREDRIATLPDHVIKYKSKIDILICTPGRLVEHIKYTPGFSLDFVRWLVVDEADKLLGQHFQQWLDVVIPRLQQERCTNSRNHHHTNLSGVRKVILSATMTRDLERLGGLKLRRPNLVVLEGSGSADIDAGLTSTEHVVPELLEESALKVSDPNLKPVFLVDLLRSRKLLGDAAGKPPVKSADSDDTSSSEEAETSSSEEDTSSDEGSDSDASSQHSTASHHHSTIKQTRTPSVLIFTKSNETAMRLSRLLSLISPKLTPLLGTLTSTTAYSTRRQTLRDFSAGKLRVLVASDLVARGIDLPSLDHVINYDMPTSVASYIHRVGRTARAGKSGKAWTLFTKAEARWFWTEIAGQKTIKRPKEVQRIRITEEKEDMFEEKVKIYEDALETLGQEAKRGRN